MPQKLLNQILTVACLWFVFFPCFEKALASDLNALHPALDPQAEHMRIKDISEKGLDDFEYQNRQIPRIIHQIWIGPKPLPSHSKIWEAYAKKHKYIYKLWREADIESFGLKNRTQFESDRGGYPGKADVARYEILFRFGGVYIDIDILPTDFERDLFTRFPSTNAVFWPEWRGRDVGQRMALFVQNNFMALAPNHPIMARVIESIPDNFESTKMLTGGPSLMFGPFLLTRCLLGPFTILASSTFMGPDSDIDQTMTKEAKTHLVYTVVSYPEQKNFIHLPDIWFKNDQYLNQSIDREGQELLTIKKKKKSSFFYDQVARISYDSGRDIEAIDTNSKSKFSTLKSLFLFENDIDVLKINGLTYAGRGEISAESQLLDKVYNEPLAVSLQRCKNNIACTGILHVSSEIELLRSASLDTSTYYLGKGGFESREMAETFSAIAFKK